MTAWPEAAEQTFVVAKAMLGIIDWRQARIDLAIWNDGSLLADRTGWQVSVRLHFRDYLACVGLGSCPASK